MNEKQNKKNEFSRADTTLMGNTDVNYEISTSSADFNLFLGSSNVVDFKFNKKKEKIEVVFRQHSNVSLLNGKQSPDKVWKEIYGIKDGKLQLLDTIEGKHNPGYYVEETIQFDEKKETKA